MNYTTAMVQLPLVKEAPRERIRTAEDVWRICEDLRDLAQESFHVLTLNAKNRLIDRHMITTGIADASLVHPREVFQRAIHDGASSIVLAHNHPSGDPAPSAEDIRITKQLVAAGGIVDIKVLDHVIIGRPVAGFGVNSIDPNGHSFVSLREQGICSFA